MPDLFGLPAPAAVVLLLAGMTAASDWYCAGPPHGRSALAFLATLADTERLVRVHSAVHHRDQLGDPRIGLRRAAGHPAALTDDPDVRKRTVARPSSQDWILKRGPTFTLLTESCILFAIVHVPIHDRRSPPA